MAQIMKLVVGGALQMRPELSRWTAGEGSRAAWGEVTAAIVPTKITSAFLGC